MIRPNLERMSLAELKALLAHIDATMVEREKTERAALRQKMEAMAAQAGFDIREVLGHGLKGTKVAIKYRNPKNTAQTWSGRGRMPLWMADAIKKGAKKDSFLV